MKNAYSVQTHKVRLVSITDSLRELLSAISTAKDAVNVIAHIYMLQIVSAGYCLININDPDMQTVQSNLA